MKSAKPEDVLGWLRPGQRIYVQGGPGECTAFIDLLKRYPERAAGLEIWSCLIPGINGFDYGSLPGGPSLVTFMASPVLEASIASGRTRIDPMPYSEIGALLKRTDFDLAILHVAAPDAHGLCSFGIACEAPGIVWPRAAKRVAFLNRRMPHIPCSEAIASDGLDLAVEIDEPLLSPATPGPRSKTLEAIARRAADLVPDGAVIQSGIGEAPGAIVAALRDHKRLRAYSGVITPDYRLLAEAGALDMDAEHVAGIAWGDAGFYRWLEAPGLFAFRSALETHGRERLAGLAGFVSIGSALEIDLGGNINLEWRAGRRVSSVGGAPDFMAAARLSRDGRSIIALPAVAGNGASRIVPKLAKPSIPAEYADAIVTEYGVANLRGLAPSARAAVLIAIAAPEHRDALAASVGRDS
jgi:acyl-CoA hydrolase